MYAATNRRKISCLAQEKKQEGGTVKRQACVLASRGYRLEGVCAHQSSADSWCGGELAAACSTIGVAYCWCHDRSHLPVSNACLFSLPGYQRKLRPPTPFTT